MSFSPKDRLTLQQIHQLLLSQKTEITQIQITLKNHEKILNKLNSKNKNCSLQESNKYTETEMQLNGLSDDFKLLDILPVESLTIDKESKKKISIPKVNSFRINQKTYREVLLNPEPSTRILNGVKLKPNNKFQITPQSEEFLSEISNLGPWWQRMLSI